MACTGQRWLAVIGLQARPVPRKDPADVEGRPRGLRRTRCPLRCVSQDHRPGRTSSRGLLGDRRLCRGLPRVQRPGPDRRRSHHEVRAAQHGPGLLRIAYRTGRGRGWHSDFPSWRSTRRPGTEADPARWPPLVSPVCTRDNPRVFTGATGPPGPGLWKSPQTRSRRPPWSPFTFTRRPPRAPEQFLAKPTDFGPGRSLGNFPNSADGYLRGTSTRATATLTSPKGPRASGNACTMTGPTRTGSRW